MNNANTPPSHRLHCRLFRWGRRQRRSAAGHFVRGLSYGAGLTATSAVGYWLQQLW
ncbi:hypothetical protein [Streptomyces stackebrandtii]|uniref:hypothetical protein n=1 Tax=Streptomyces stackebrandtii TaxID=3051177 RepID=UPI0028DC98FE|nr:hypothetical protein [Streptomyces sp. DSM 40976]